MKILIIFFSGTGNTKLTSEILAENLRYLGHSVTSKSIEQDFDIAIVNEFDCIGLGFPVYAWRAPGIFSKFVRRLPLLNEKPCFIFNTRAIASWWSNYYVGKIIDSKSGIVIDSENFTTPPNDWMVLFSKSNYLVKRYVHFSEDYQIRLSHFADSIDVILKKKKYKKHRLNLNPLGILASGLIHLPAIKVMGIIKKHWSVDNSKCIKCGKCEKMCPSGNISMNKDNLPEWSTKCCLCFRCINYCPENAILLTKASKGKYRYKMNLKLF